MKRGKEEEEKVKKGVMFPRIKVNDRGGGGGKGGPRAPPRNKMALYQHLSIPSQGTSHDPNMFFPRYPPPSTSLYDEGANRKPPSDEDDFMVPIYSQPIHVQSQNHLTPPGVVDQTTSHSRELFSKQTSSRISDALIKETNVRLPKKDACSQSGYENQNRMSSLEKTVASLRQDHDDDLSVLDGTNGLADLDHAHINCRSRDDNETDSGVEEYQSLEKECMDKGNVSEASVLDTVTSLDISPDDVVRIIGRKHFWVARTAIAKQQRLFAVQIFELHRLLKVQKLIAESPELLLGSAFLDKSSLKSCTVKKYSSDYAVKAFDHKSASKDVSHKGTDKVEGTAENAVTKSPPVPLQNAIKQAPYQPSAVNSVSSFSPVNTNPKMNPWSFPQPGPHQWLVPVMSPSEGLVYKPYPASGFLGPNCGGCGPEGPMPAINPGYGMPTPQFQGMIMPPGIHFGGQGYFPPYGMPLPMPMPMISPSMSGSTVEQLNPFSGTNPYPQMSQPVGTGVNFGNMQHQGSLNMPSQMNGMVTPVVRPESTLQGSCASSPSQRSQELCTAPLNEREDGLALFPTTKISEGSPNEKPTRVIRVVPHKPGSTRESAARIFQSIQQGRQQFE